MTDPQINSWDRLPPVPMDTTRFDVACRDRSPLGAAVLLIAPFTKVMQTLAFGANEQVRRAAAVSKEMETFLAALKAADADGVIQAVRLAPRDHKLLDVDRLVRLNTGLEDRVAAVFGVELGERPTLEGVLKKMKAAVSAGEA